jgi:hypothetical protein
MQMTAIEPAAGMVHLTTMLAHAPGVDRRRLAGLFRRGNRPSPAKGGGADLARRYAWLASPARMTLMRRSL